MTDKFVDFIRQQIDAWFQDTFDLSQTVREGENVFLDVKHKGNALASIWLESKGGRTASWKYVKDMADLVVKTLRRDT